MSKKKKSVGVVLLGICIIVVVVCMTRDKNYIKHNDAIKYREYFHVYDYERVIAEKGKPQKEMLVEVDEGDKIVKKCLVYYEGVVHVFSYNEKKHEIGRENYLQIMSNQYALGWRKVCVGNKRSRIEEIFKNSKSYSEMELPFYDEQGNVTMEKIIFYSSNNYLCYFGFVYDEQDRVKAIRISLGGLV